MCVYILKSFEALETYNLLREQKLDNAALEESLMWLKKVYKMYIFTKYQFVQFLMFGAQKEGNQFPKVF